MLESDDTENAQLVNSVTGRNEGITELRARIRDAWQQLSAAGRAAAEVLAELPPERLLYLTAIELGAETRTSNATVVRTLQQLGYSGLADLKGRVAGPFTSETAPEVRAKQRLDATGGDLRRIWERVTTEAIDRIELLRRNLDHEAYVAAVGLLSQASTVHTYGWGASFVAAEHLTLRLGRVGVRARTIMNSGFRLADDLLTIRREDVVVLLAPARLPVDVATLMERTRVVGAASILITDELLEKARDRVTITLHAPHSPTGLSSEPTSTIVWADILAQGVAASDPDRAVEASHTLTTQRQQLGFGR